MTQSFQVSLSSCCLKFRSSIYELYWKLLAFFLQFPLVLHATLSCQIPKTLPSHVITVMHSVSNMRVYICIGISKPTFSHAGLCLILASCCCESQYREEAFSLKHFLPVCKDTFHSVFQLSNFKDNSKQIINYILLTNDEKVIYPNNPWGKKILEAPEICIMTRISCL